LWIANIDGSGERKLVDIKNNTEWSKDVQLHWSPNGKWISYFSDNQLWIVSPDGSVNRKLFPRLRERQFFLYKWSPDSSKIAYLTTFPAELTNTPTSGPWQGLEPYLVGIIDIYTGDVSELSSFQANAGIPVLSWSPNGRYLLFIKDFSFVLFDEASRKIVKEIKRGCGLERSLSWSPNGQWFSYTDNGVGRYFSQRICVNGVYNSVHEVDIDGTASVPVWDKTGNFLYFVARKTNPDGIRDLKIDERLMKYDVRTQKTERLLSLRDQQIEDYIQSVSMSPDGRTLLLQSKSSKTTYDLIFVNTQSLATPKFTLDFTVLKIPLKDAYDSYFLETGWSPNSQSIIFSAGTVCTPERTCVQHYGAFYIMDVKIGKINTFSGDHPVDAWKIAPITAHP
jgi:Tol biopolymer transport system component